MKPAFRPLLTRLALLAALLVGCAVAPPVTPSTSAYSSSPSETRAPLYTSTPVHTEIATIVPSPTPLPGTLVFPIDTLASSIPWLPPDPNARTNVNFVAFNTRQPPFNSPIVRRAFGHAIDHDPLIEMARRYGIPEATPATTLTPPEILGRDLSGVVGIAFDPNKAKDLLTEAGYSDPSSFPRTVFLVSGYGAYPGARFNIATAMAEMWKTNLGVNVEIQVVPEFRQYYDRLKTTPPGLFWYGWAADYNDPDNFLRELFNSHSEPIGGFSSPAFDELVEDARTSNDPAERQEFYIEAERLLNEVEAAIIPVFHS